MIKFKTSKEYKILLKKGSDKNDKTVKIKHATIKREHNKYYAVINIECIYTPIKKTGHLQIGIDIGCDKLAVLSNKQEIANLDLKKEMQKIIHYQKIMNKHEKDSNRYREAKRLHNKWWEKFINKREDYYNKKSTNIMKNSIFIAVQNENIISWKQNKKIGRKIQINAPKLFMEKLEYKSKWNRIPFVKIPKKFPSTQKCSRCGYKNKKIKGIKNLGKQDWICPKCRTYHNRDVNAAINILKEGLKIFNRRDDGAVNFPKK